MAKPYLIFKAHTGIYYAQIRLADGTLSNNKSTGCRNRAEAERTVMQWIVTGNIPVRVNSKDNKVQSIDKVRLFNDLRNADFDNDDINNIIKILTERNYLYSAVPKNSKGSIPIEDFLENFWDYDKSPYVREKLGFENPGDICFHSWRHFFCSRMLDYVQDKRYVMALSGFFRFPINKLPVDIRNPALSVNHEQTFF